jgi:hypothetical protein
MRLPRWLHPIIVLVLLAVAAPHAAAQDKLPAKMSGKWNGTFPGKGTPFGGSWSVVIDRQNPDGTIEGKATWGGGQYCVMDNEPFTGKFDGAELTIVAQWRDKIPNAQCGKANMVLKKKGDDFDGAIPGSRFRYLLTLSPS